MSWIYAAILAAVYSFGFMSGFYSKAHWFSEISYIGVKYKNDAGKIINNTAIKYGHEIYYPSDFINRWLVDHDKGKSQLKNKL